MSFKKAIVSSTVALALAGTAFAASENGGRIVVDADGTGDYLLFPSYYANSAGWSTNVRLVNTNTTHSMIAKVVVREAKNSLEILDFPVYLTPGDVFEGSLYEESGKVKFHSNDDSMVFAGVPANIANGGNGYTLEANVPGDANIFQGYVEVFGNGMTNRQYTYNNNGLMKIVDLGKAPVEKEELYKEYKTTSGGAVGEWTPVDNHSLMGQAVVLADNENGKLAMTYTATALDNFVGNKVATWNNIVGQNSTLDLLIETAPRTIAEAIDGYEDAIDKIESYAIHYGNESAMDETVITATFPTKKYRLENNTISDVFKTGNGGSLSSGWYVTYQATPRDMMENTPAGKECEVSPCPEISPQSCFDELCYIDVSGDTPYNSGYVTYTFYGANSLNPMPYAAQVMTAKSVGGTNVTNMVVPQYRMVSTVSQMN